MHSAVVEYMRMMPMVVSQLIKEGDRARAEDRVSWLEKMLSKLNAQDPELLMACKEQLS